MIMDMFDSSEIQLPEANWHMKLAPSTCHQENNEELQESKEKKHDTKEKKHE